MMIDLHNAIKKYGMNITGVIHIGGHVGTEYDEYIKVEESKQGAGIYISSEAARFIKGE